MLFSKVLVTVSVAAGFLSGSVEAKKRDNIWLIRHAEKPDDYNSKGLSERGIQRTECIRDLFSAPQYNIGYIIAQKPRWNGKRARPLLTVTPLAKKLGLTVDTSCSRDDEDCVEDIVDRFQKQKGNKGKGILICWERDELEDVAEELDAKGVDDYPRGRFDQIWHIQNGKLSTSSENCPGLDK